MTKHECEHCGRELDSPPGLAGKAGVCPACGYETLVPSSGVNYSAGLWPIIIFFAAWFVHCLLQFRGVTIATAAETLPVTAFSLLVAFPLRPILPGRTLRKRMMWALILGAVFHVVALVWFIMEIEQLGLSPGPSDRDRVNHVFYVWLWTPVVIGAVWRAVSWTYQGVRTRYRGY